MIEALSLLPDGAAKEIQPGEISKFKVIRIADEIVVDLMAVASGIEFPEASKKIAKITVNGIVIPFADIDLMIQLKQGVRPKDKMDLEFLKALKAQKNK